MVQNRTFDMMVFKKSGEEKLFKSFQECFRYWFDLASENGNIDIDEIFRVEQDQKGAYKPRIMEINGNPQTIREQRELDLYNNLESKFECSGMCQSGLFFFTKELHEGPP